MKRSLVCYGGALRASHFISDITKQCRLCLKSSDALQPIFQDDSPLSLEARIRSALNIVVMKDARLPMNICETCKLEVERFYKFRRMCEIADQKLQLHMVSEGISFKPRWNANKEIPKPLLTKESSPVKENNEFVEVAHPLSKSEELCSQIRSAVLQQDGGMFQLGLPRLELTTLDGSVVTMQILEQSNDDKAEPDIPLKVTLPVALEKLPVVSDQDERKRKKVELYLCKACGKQCVSATKLYRHERTHTGVRPYACKKCGKRYTQKESMKRHGYTHLAARSHNCGTCTKSFSHRSSLTLHEKVREPVPRPLQLRKCPLCPKVFLYASGLSRHMREHNGKAFRCDRCIRTFKDKSSFRRHIKAVHHLQENKKDGRFSKDNSEESEENVDDPVGINRIADSEI